MKDFLSDSLILFPPLPLIQHLAKSLTHVDTDPHPVCPVCVFLFVLFWFCFFRDRVSLFNYPGCPETHFADQTGHELTEIPLPLPRTTTAQQSCACLGKWKTENTPWQTAQRGARFLRLEDTWWGSLRHDLVQGL